MRADRIVFVRGGEREREHSYFAIVYPNIRQIQHEDSPGVPHSEPAALEELLFSATECL